MKNLAEAITDALRAEFGGEDESPTSEESIRAMQAIQHVLDGAKAAGYLCANGPQSGEECFKVDMFVPVEDLNLHAAESGGKLVKLIAVNGGGK